MTILALLSHAAGWAGEELFVYQNPIRDGIHKGGIRDAQIFEDAGKYYLVGTCAPFWKGPNPGVKIYSSDNVLAWNYEGLLIERDKLDPSVWYYDRFWAPEIHKISGKYYLLFNARNELGTQKHDHGTAVAMADAVLGPYTVLTHDAPFSNGNDLSFFEDDDGAVYAFWNRHEMFAARVDMEHMKPVDERPIFAPQEGTWDAVGIEGSYCIKRNGTYYLFYSSWTLGYEIGYATAKHPLGPWTKFESNPIYGAQSLAACRKRGLPFTTDPDSPFAAVGHNEVWNGPDGRLWISCHGNLKDGGTPYLVIDPISFDEDGNMTIEGPTYTEQTITVHGDAQSPVAEPGQ